ncbi:hypothetical protein FKM82_012694 [Ascaphus truei]
MSRAGPHTAPMSCAGPHTAPMSPAGPHIPADGIPRLPPHPPDDPATRRGSPCPQAPTIAQMSPAGPHTPMSPTSPPQSRAHTDPYVPQAPPQKMAPMSPQPPTRRPLSPAGPSTEGREQAAQLSPLRGPPTGGTCRDRSPGAAPPQKAPRIPRRPPRVADVPLQGASRRPIVPDTSRSPPPLPWRSPMRRGPPTNFPDFPPGLQPVPQGPLARPPSRGSPDFPTQSPEQPRVPPQPPSRPMSPVAECQGGPHKRRDRFPYAACPPRHSRIVPHPPRCPGMCPPGRPAQIGPRWSP